MKRISAVLLLLLLGCATSSPPPAATQPAKRTPVAAEPATPPAPPWPVAKKEVHLRDLQGEKFNDDYFWLRDKGTPEVEAYLNAEEAYARKQLAPLEPLAESLYKEIITHVAEDDASPPVKDGAYEYWSRVEAGSSTPCSCATSCPAAPKR